MAVDVRPSRLYHADFRIGEMMDTLQQKVRWRNKIGIEDRDEFSLCRFQACFQSARFEALTILTVDVCDRMSQCGIAFDQNARDLYGFVGRVIEQLNVELIFRILESAHCVE